jgi:hypothetical protein
MREVTPSWLDDVALSLLKVKGLVCGKLKCCMNGLLDLWKLIVGADWDTKDVTVDAYIKDILDLETRHLGKR